LGKFRVKHDTEIGIAGYIQTGPEELVYVEGNDECTVLTFLWLYTGGQLLRHVSILAKVIAASQRVFRLS